MSIFQKLFPPKAEPPPTEEQILQKIIAGQNYDEPPQFCYFPRAYEDGTFHPADGVVCSCCGKETPFLYSGHFYSNEHGHEHDFKPVCPWCVASGAAAMKYHGVFCKAKDITGVPEDVQKIIREKTPCFEGWKEEQWPAHCGDMMEYLGTAGFEELLASESQELLADLTALAEEEVSWDGGKAESVLKRLDGDGSPRAYVFRCRACGILSGYYDYKP